jgi:O-acetyl-ADP-ribose deacetylase
VKWGSEPLGRFICSELVERESSGPAVIECIVADITRLSVHVIVNAADPSLLGGGGVDGAIHAAAGPELVEACRELPEKRPGVRCEPGDAVMTPGFKLEALAVVHTVGPVWEGGGAGEAETLASCYRRCVELADKQLLPRIAFPSISTGAYGFPPEEAARITVSALREALRRAAEVGVVTLCCFDEEMAGVVGNALSHR